MDIAKKIAEELEIKVTQVEVIVLASHGFI